MILIEHYVSQTLSSDAADVDIRVEDSSPTQRMWNVEVFMQAAKELVSVFYSFFQRFSS